MKNKNGIYIIGVDHGYGNIKTANYCFPTGLTAYDTEPLFTGNMLVYNDRYYLIGVGHKTNIPEKTLDEDYYILTLAAIAMELNRENLTEASIHISAGLPLSWVQEQKAAYHAYLLKNKEVQFVFCINSVSFKDGGKYNFSKRELKRLRDTSDRLCRVYGLSVVEHPHKAPSRQVWLDEQAGKLTRYNIYQADVQEAIARSITGRGMVQHLRGQGYIVDSRGPSLKIRLPQYPHFTRLDTLNPQWTNQGIEHLIYDRDELISSRSKPPRKPDIPDWLKEAYQPRKRTTKIYRLYLYYCYQLGILPKGTTYHPVSPQLRADLRHLDDIDRQTRYLASRNIETVEELLADRVAKESQLEALTTQRTKLQNKIRRASPEQKILLRKEKAEVTARIIALRKDIRDSKEIEQRSQEIQDTLDRSYEAEHPQHEKNKRMEVNQNRGR